jgi:hypothetical protein
MCLYFNKNVPGNGSLSLEKFVTFDLDPDPHKMV